MLPGPAVAMLTTMSYQAVVAVVPVPGARDISQRIGLALVILYAAAGVVLALAMKYTLPATRAADKIVETTGGTVPLTLL